MPPRTDDGSPARSLLLPLAAIAALVVLRLPALLHPVLDVDEAIYGLFARIWFDGGIPYVDCVETKPLGIYAFFGLIFSIFGRFNMIAVHAVTIGVVGLTALVVGRTAMLIFPPNGAKPAGDAAIGWWAALLYLVFTTTYIPKVIATTIEPILLLPVALQYWLWIRYEREGKRQLAIAAGAALGLACCFKYQAGMNLAVMLAYLVVARPLMLRGQGARGMLCGFLYFLLGAMIAPFLMLAYLKHAGALAGFWFWNVQGNAEYIAGGAIGIDLGRQLLTRVLPYIASTALLWALSVAGAAGILSRLRRGPYRTPAEAERLLVLLWFVLSFVPVSMGHRFYGHYFLLLLPPMAILGAPVAQRAMAGGRRLIAALVIVGIAVPAIGFFAARFFIPEINRAFGEDNLADYRPAAAYVAERTLPSDRIVIWGFAPMIAWDAQRLPGTRFFWSDLLTGRVPGLSGQTAETAKPGIMPEAWEMFLDDLARHRPAYIIDTAPANLHDYGAFPIAAYPLLAEELASSYRREAELGGITFYRRIAPDPASPR